MGKFLVHIRNLCPSRTTSLLPPLVTLRGKSKGFYFVLVIYQTSWFARPSIARVNFINPTLWLCFFNNLRNLYKGFLLSHLFSETLERLVWYLACLGDYVWVHELPKQFDLLFGLAQTNKFNMYIVYLISLFSTLVVNIAHFQVFLSYS